MPLSVIGAGLPRTGTMSLKLALEQLGFGPCFHMSEMLQTPIVEPWLPAMRGEPVDWEGAFQGYRAAVDFPTARFYGELAQAFPDAKVVLTVRDRDPDAWFRSTQATVFSPDSPRLNRPEAAPPPTALEAVLGEVVGSYFDYRLHDREAMLAVYHRHNEAVRRTTPPERLLVYDAAEGWAPLCAFLGVAIPQTPPPKANSTEDFNQWRPQRDAAWRDYGAAGR